MSNGQCGPLLCNPKKTSLGNQNENKRIADLWGLAPVRRYSYRSSDSRSSWRLWLGRVNPSTSQCRLGTFWLPPFYRFQGSFTRRGGGRHEKYDEVKSAVLNWGKDVECKFFRQEIHESTSRYEMNTKRNCDYLEKLLNLYVKYPVIFVFFFFGK